MTSFIIIIKNNLICTIVYLRESHTLTEKPKEDAKVIKV